MSSDGREEAQKAQGEVCYCSACWRSRSLTALVEGLRESAEVKGLLLDAVFDLWALQRVPLLCSAGLDGREEAQEAQDQECSRKGAEAQGFDKWLYDRAADALAYECALAVCNGVLDSRSKIADALLDYLNIGCGGPDDVPTWMRSYEIKTGIPPINGSQKKPIFKQRQLSASAPLREDSLDVKGGA